VVVPHGSTLFATWPESCLEIKTKQFLATTFSLLVLAFSAFPQRWEVMDLFHARDVSVADSLHIWISTDSCLHRSTDGGYSWTILPNDSGMTIWDIEFTDAANGWGFACDKLIRTEDAGQTWTLLFNLYPDAIYSGLNFLNGEIGCFSQYIYGQNWWWLHYTTGGGVWNSAEVYAIYEAVFVTPLTGWARGDWYETVSRTVGGPGGNWQECYRNQSGLLEFGPIDSLTCCIASRSNDSTERGLFLTTDGGATWSRRDTAVYDQMAFNRRRTGLITGDRCLFTSDGGSSWIECPQPPMAFNIMKMASNGEVWCTGFDSGVLHFIPPAAGSVEPIKDLLPRSVTLAVYPNPFNSTAMISFSLLRPSAVHLAVFDILGRLAYSVDLGKLAVGEYLHRFDGSALPSGVYLCQLEADKETQTKKMVLLK
jgi:photosystem II stability/assembly factor-like uncharacterized protein